MTQFLLSQNVSFGIVASIMLAVWTDLASGALDGIIAGLIVGAIVIPLIQTPDALGRALLVGLLLGLGMAVYQLLRVGQVTGASLGSIINSLDGATGTVVGQMMKGPGLVDLAPCRAGFRV